MDKKQTDRRPDEKPAPQNPGRPDVTKPDAARRPPGDSADRKGFAKPEGNPIDKQMPKPGGWQRGQGHLRERAERPRVGTPRPAGGRQRARGWPPAGGLRGPEALPGRTTEAVVSGRAARSRTALEEEPSRAVPSGRRQTRPVRKSISRMIKTSPSPPLG